MEQFTRDIQEKELDIIEGEFINISQSTVRNVEGGHVELQQVCALSIDGERTETTQTAAMLVKGGDVNLNQGCSITTIGNHMALEYSFSPFVFSRGETTFTNSASGILAAHTVKADNSAALLVMANRVEGNISTVLDWKSTVAFGAVLGGILGFIALIRKR